MRPPLEVVAAAPPPAAPGPDAAAEHEDQSLIVAAQQGDREAFGRIVERHQGAVYGYLRARVLQAADAEDLTQEVFLRCYSCWARFDASSRVRPWLLGIARNLLHEHIRRARRRREAAWTELCLELDEMVTHNEQVHDERLVHLPGCLNGLGDSARQAIEMRYGARLRLSEIGEKLKRSEGAAKLLMFRARQALKSCLDRKHPGDGHDG